MIPIETVKAIRETATLLKKHKEVISISFYENIAQDYPEILNVFNHLKKKIGYQQLSLLDTLYTASLQIDSNNLDTLMPTVVQIAHKHRSLGIKSEYYTIVGRNLIAAMREVGDGEFTNEIIDAFQLAYNKVADIFIQLEEDLYKETEAKGGWRFFKPFRVVKKEDENEFVKSIYLVPLDGKVVPIFEGGQYISLRITLPNEMYALNRQYSVSQGPTSIGYRISVAQEGGHDANAKVSNYLYEDLQVGDIVDVSAPAGLFKLEKTSKPIVFIADGIGVAPLNSMLQSLDDRTPNAITFIQAARNKKVVIYSSEIEKKLANLKNGHYEFIIDTEQQSSLVELIRHKIDKESEVYLCGPTPFMEKVIQLLHDAGLKNEQIHYEFFGPAIQF